MKTLQQTINEFKENGATIANVIESATGQTTILVLHDEMTLNQKFANAIVQFYNSKVSFGGRGLIVDLYI